MLKLAGRLSVRARTLTVTSTPTATPLTAAVARCTRIAPVARQLSWFSAPTDNTTVPDEKDHAKGRDLEQVEAANRGEERFTLGEYKGPFGTFKNPTVIHSANPERVVGCLGDGAEFEHSLLWMMVKDNGKKHMCQACGQFFILKRDPSGAAAPIH